MKVEVIGKNGFEPSQRNKEFISTKLEKVAQYFQEEELKARVVCKVYSSFHKVEVTIPTKNIVLRAEAKADDLYSAVDISIDKLERQVRKYKTRVKEHKGKDALKDTFAEGYLRLEKEPVKVAKVVREKTVQLVPMTEEEAEEQLELTGHDFYIYLDSATLEVKVLYVREDGDYAIITTTK